MRRVASMIVLALAVASITARAAAEDWPTHLHDHARSGVSSEKVELPLSLRWVYRAPLKPVTAWPGPATRDGYNKVENMTPRSQFDRALQVAVVGDRVYFNVPSSDKVCAVDAGTGAEHWSHYAEGPVRLGPTVDGQRVYFGADDGQVHCLAAADGSLEWKYRAAPADRIVPGNGRLMSLWPVRTGVVVDGERAYFCAGLFPAEASYCCAVDKLTGRELWKTQQQDFAPQGHLLAAADRLYVPQGRDTPRAVDRATGALLGAFRGDGRGPGGTYALLASDLLIGGPNATGSVAAYDTEGRQQLASFKGRHVIVTPGASYLQSEDELVALDFRRSVDLQRQRERAAAELRTLYAARRKLDENADRAKIAELEVEIETAAAQVTKLRRDAESCEVWKRHSELSDALILAGDVLFAGGPGRVAAYAADDGRLLWQADVPGNACELAAAGGRLLVSTDRGEIHCFASGDPPNDVAVRPDAPADPFPEHAASDVYAAAAERIIAETGIRQGYCLVSDSGDGRLAYQLARRTKLKVLGVEADADRAAASRAVLDRAGLYGDRVSIRTGTLDQLPLTALVANLIVSDGLIARGDLSLSAAQVTRLLRPAGGVVYLGRPSGAGPLARDALEQWAADSALADWQFDDEDGTWCWLRREPLPRAGAWTHQYGTAGNTSASADGLLTGNMAVQWFGRPGPRPMLDRGARSPAPLVAGGRLYVQGDRQLFGLDAYNGTILWHRQFPKLRRVNIPRDASNMVATDDALYVAIDDVCLQLDGQTGAQGATLELPAADVPADEYQWGYLASAEGMIFGSGVKPGSFYTGADGEWYDKGGAEAEKVTSDFLFARRQSDGGLSWTFHSGAIINCTIAVGDGTMFFIESRNPACRSLTTGRIGDELLDGQYLVALDAATGRKLWERAADFSNCSTVCYLTYADGTLVVLGTRDQYYAYGFDARDGTPLWQQNYPWHRDNHGGMLQHPVVVGDTVYAEPRIMKLHTGELMAETMPARTGCGTITGSASCLFYRDGVHGMWDLESDERRGWSGLRPGCWLSIIPAGGLMLCPESSSGCSCSQPIQTSIAFIPVSLSADGH